MKYNYSDMTYEQAKQEYFQIFPNLKKVYEGPRRILLGAVQQTASGLITGEAMTAAWHPLEGFVMFKTYDAMQVYCFSSPGVSRGHVYPGKLITVTDDPDSSKNGLYMVTCEFYDDSGQLGKRNWGFIKMTLA